LFFEKDNFSLLLLLLFSFCCDDEFFKVSSATDYLICDELSLSDTRTQSVCFVLFYFVLFVEKKELTREDLPN
jgi:hypothetical protein